MKAYKLELHFASYKEKPDKNGLTKSMSQGFICLWSRCFQSTVQVDRNIERSAKT